MDFYQNAWYRICVEGRAATLAWTACTSNGTNWRRSCLRLSNRGFETLTRHELCDVVHMKVVVHTAVGPRDLSLGVETLADSCQDATQPKLGFVVCFRCFGILNHLMTFIATPFGSDSWFKMGRLIGTCIGGQRSLLHVATLCWLPICWVMSSGLSFAHIKAWSWTSCSID